MASLVKRIRYHCENKKTFKKYLTNMIFREAETKFDEGAYHKYIKIPDGVTEILDQGFSSTISLKSIIISKSVKSIGDYSFYNCSSLKHIVIPEGVFIIGYRAFDGCSNLKSVNMPESINYLGNKSFAFCRNMKKLSIPEKYKYCITKKDCNVFDCLDLPNVEITYF